MKTIVAVNLALISALVVAGSKFEAMDGQNVTISFDTDEVEKADEVRITFKEDKKEYAELIAQKPWVYDDPPRPGVTLIVGKGCLSVIIQNVNISRSGLYKAEAYTGGKVCEVTATLVVNKAPVSSSPAPPHSSSISPTPLSSSNLRGHYALIPVFICIIFIIFIILCVCFWKHGMATLVVAGSKIEAIDGQNVTISFDIDEVEKADEVRISFKEDKKEYAELIAQKPWVYDDPPRPGVTLIVGKGCLSVIIQNVNISRSGLYKAEAYTGGKVCEVTATLVVSSESSSFLQSSSSTLLLQPNTSQLL
ncbi:unnamed protein product [Leuciscus chuanchicus]